MTRAIMRRMLVVVAVVLVLVVAGSAAAQERDYGANSFDVAVVVQDDGSLLVTESVTFHFIGGPFSFVFRELESDLSDGIVDITAGVDGQVWSPGEAPGEVEISGRDPVRVEWNLPPTSDTTQTFTLTYRMLGVVQQTEEADLLVYQPLPDEHDYPIGSSTVVFSYPATAELIGQPVVTTGNANVDVDAAANQITLTAQNLDPDETLVVEIPFAPGSLIAEPPLWQQQRARQLAAWPMWVGAGVASLILGAIVLVIVYRRHRPAPTSAPERLYEPPSDLAPALAGALTRRGEPSWQHALGTLFDLARRDVLRIDESEEKKWYRQHDFVIQQLREPGDSRPHEEGLLDALFEDKRGRTDEVKLSELSSRMSSRQWKLFSEPLEDELKLAGWTDAARKRARTRFGVGALILMLGGMTLGILLAIFVNPWALALGAGLFFVGLLAAILGSMLPALSDEGAARGAEWQAFADHLKDVSRGKAAVSGPEMFDRFLPYAAAFGLLRDWGKWFEKEGWTEMPGYFHAVATSPEARNAAFVALIIASSSSGGSASGSASGAGGGAAGGGASGAG